jgi:hypothetical protein
MAENGTDSSKPLSAAQHKAIAALLVSRNLRDAAKVADVPERTLWRWAGDPRFLAALHSAEGGLIETSMRRLLQLSEKAIDQLDSLLDSPKPELRLRAAQTVLDQLLTLRELTNVESRLAALEAIQYVKPEA